MKLAEICLELAEIRRTIDSGEYTQLKDSGDLELIEKIVNLKKNNAELKSRVARVFAVKQSLFSNL